MAKYVLFVEGAEAVRLGLGPLLDQELRNRNPKIIACGDLNRTIKRFLDELHQARFPGTVPLLLIDLDGPATRQKAVEAAKGLTAHAAQTFWMVQAMEAWFLAHPDVLDRFYGKRVSAHLPAAAPSAVAKPDQELYKATKTARVEQYNKTAHPPGLLPLLSLTTLRRIFPDVERLIQRLST